MRVAELISSPVLTIGPETPVRRAAAMLAEHRVGSAPVVDRAGRLVEILAETDLIEGAAADDPLSTKIRTAPPRWPPGPRAVAELMSRPTPALPGSLAACWTTARSAVFGNA